MNELEIEPQEWLDIFERDYLASFVREGGAATKVLVVEPELAPELARRLLAVAERNGLLTAHVDQTVQRVYYMDRLFNEVARQIEWRRLANDFMRGALRSHGYAMPDGDPVVDEVAAANSIDVGQVRITVQQLLSNSVIKEYTMARDFRVAMNQICRAAVERDDLLTELAARVVEWLRGDLRSVRPLRSAMIFERINRYNARSMLASLGQWVRRAGKSGLLIAVDVSRFASGRPILGMDGTQMRPPSKAAVMDAYEMMRQCIDCTDEMYGVGICFLTGPEFVQDDRRGMRAYSALEQRLTDDVRDRRRSNPHAPMVRIASSWS
jgi:P-loop Domain of unknown function (DUF2791)